MPIDNSDLNELLIKATKLQTPKKKMKLSLWKRIVLAIRLKYIWFTGRFK